MSSCDPCGNSVGNLDKILDVLTGNKNSSTNGSSNNANNAIVNNNNEQKDLSNSLTELTNVLNNNNRNEFGSLDDPLFLTEAVNNLRNKLLLKYLEIDFEFYGNRIIRYRG